MDNLLSLKGKNISLINIDEKNMRSNNYSSYISKIRFKNIRNIYLKLLVQANNSGQIIGYILSYNYNKIDGHIRIDTEIDEKYYKDYFKETLLLFCNYLYTCFPIRKIYLETINNSNINIELLNNLHFIKEACLKQDTFFNNTYYDKYIFTLDVSNFFEVE